MSLLLNALKKAEEGGEKEEKASTTPSSAPPAGGDAAGSSPTVASSAPSLAPNIVKAPGLVGGESGQDQLSQTPGKGRVEAARVFGAGAEDVKEEKGSRKLVFSVLAVGVVFGGGYLTLQAGLIPGLDMSILSNIPGYVQESDDPLTPRPSVSDIGEKLTAGGGAAASLPIPNIDVQSELDFAAFSLPENQRDNLGDAAYAEKVAVLTGFDYRQEDGLTQDDIDVQIGDAEIEIGEGPSGASTVTTAVVKEKILHTADLSREAKFDIDVRTPSDGLLDIRIGEPPVEEEPSEQVAEQAEPAGSGEKITDLGDGSMIVAQMDIKASDEGAERKRKLEEARRLYYEGKYVEAESIYLGILAKTPASRDALRGVAQLAIATGRYQAAVATYLDLLRYYPNDAVAVAELSNLRSSRGKDFYEVEKLLKRSLGKQPEADGRIHFSLGNLYADNDRWRDAQKSYFNAFAKEPSNPDYAYNLAVVLDYLGKPDLAVRYYQEALDLSGGVKIGFRRSEAQERISQLRK